MMRRVSVIGVAGMLLAGCASAATTTATEQQAVPYGRYFTSTTITENGKPRPLVAGTAIVIGFDGSATADPSRDLVVATAGCNPMSGPARLQDGNLVVSQLATGAMGCDKAHGAQDAWLGSVLSSRPAMSISGKTLTLRAARLIITLTETPAPSPPEDLQTT